MYYIVSKICIGGRFLEDCFYCYSQQIISAVANESLIPYNLIKEHQKHRTFNTVTPNATPNQIKKNTAQFLEQMILFQKNISNKILYEVVFKMQCLKNGL